MPQHRETRDVLFSIKPKFVRLILSGEKKVELRRRQPRHIDKGSIVYIWETSPAKRLVGTVRVESVKQYTLERLWKTVARNAHVNRAEFDRYFAGSAFGVAVFISSPREFTHKVTLSTLRKRRLFLPPQSFRYVSPSVSAWIQLRSEPLNRQRRESGHRRAA